MGIAGGRNVVAMAVTGDGGGRVIGADDQEEKPDRNIHLLF